MLKHGWSIPRLCALAVPPPPPPPRLAEGDPNSKTQTPSTDKNVIISTASQPRAQLVEKSPLHTPQDGTPPPTRTHSFASRVGDNPKGGGTERGRGRGREGTVGRNTRTREANRGEKVWMEASGSRGENWKKGVCWRPLSSAPIHCLGAVRTLQEPSPSHGKQAAAPWSQSITTPPHRQPQLHYLLLSPGISPTAHMRVHGKPKKPITITRRRGRGGGERGRKHVPLQLTGSPPLPASSLETHTHWCTQRQFVRPYGERNVTRLPPPLRAVVIVYPQRLLTRKDRPTFSVLVSARPSYRRSSSEAT